MDEQGKLIPGNHFTLADDLSTIAFKTGSENIDPTTVPTLDKLASMLQVEWRRPRYAHSLCRCWRKHLAARGAPVIAHPRIGDPRLSDIERYFEFARIDVRALGANVPSGDSDRVDIKAN